MSIKFECACGRRLSAPDGSSGRWVRCPNCQVKQPVPAEEAEADGLLVAGGSGGVASLGSGVAHALEWETAKARLPGDPRRTGAADLSAEYGTGHDARRAVPRRPAACRSSDRLTDHEARPN